MGWAWPVSLARSARWSRAYGTSPVSRQGFACAAATGGTRTTARCSRARRRSGRPLCGRVRTCTTRGARGGAKTRASCCAVRYRLCCTRVNESGTFTKQTIATYLRCSVSRVASSSPPAPRTASRFHMRLLPTARRPAHSHRTNQTRAPSRWCVEAGGSESKEVRSYSPLSHLNKRYLTVATSLPLDSARYCEHQ